MGKRSRKNKMAAAYNQPQKVLTMPKTIARETSQLCAILIEKCTQPFGQNGSNEWEDYLTVYEIIQQIRIKQAKYVHLPEDREQHMAGFLDWMRENGTDTSNVEIFKFPNQGYGLKAVKDLDSGSVCIKVPRSVMLTTARASESTIGPLVKSDRLLANMPHVALAIQLLCELSNHTSFWQPYLQILPKEYSTPLYFTPEELLLLKGSPALGEALNQYRNIARQYAYFFNLFQVYADAESLPAGVRYFCYDEYRWAVSTVMTRQNHIPTSSGDGSLTALIPLWDMCNHSNGQLSTDFDVGSDCSVCYAQSAFSAGEQVTIFYGARSNTEFLLNSGFVYRENEHDKVNIKLGISKKDDMYNMKCDLLSKANYMPSAQFSLYRSEEPVDSELLLFLRVFCMDEGELKRCAAEDVRTSSLRDYDTWISRENEIRVWSFIATRAELLLRSYKTTKQTDEERLRAISLTEAERMVILLLYTEKIILQKTIDFANTMKTDVERCPSKAPMLKVLASEVTVNNHPEIHTAENGATEPVEQQPSKPATLEEEELARQIDGIELRM